MPPNETNSSTEMNLIWKGLGIAHFLLIFAPSLLIGTVTLVFVWKLMKDKKTAEINATLFLYFLITCFCVIAPSSYGILWDISLITGLSVMGKCTSYPSNVPSVLIPCILQQFISSMLALVAIVQLVTVKWGKRIGIRETAGALCVVATLSVAIPSAVIFNEQKAEEIRGSVCLMDKKQTFRNTAIIITFSYIIPLIVIFTSSLLTNRKLKEFVSDEQGANIVKSVMAVNIVNIVQFNVFKVIAIVVFYCTTLSFPDDRMVYIIATVIARYIAELSYPVTITSLLIVHKGLRTTTLLLLKRMLQILLPKYNAS